MIDHEKFADKAMAALHGRSNPEEGKGDSPSEVEPDAENEPMHHHMKMFISAVHAKDHHAASEAFHHLKKY